MPISTANVAAIISACRSNCLASGAVSRCFPQQRTYATLCSEYAYIQDYRRSWAHAPTRRPVTVGSVVIHSNHILLVRRRRSRQGAVGLAGGFVDQDVNASAMRGDPRIARRNPAESAGAGAGWLDPQLAYSTTRIALRGRTITHAYLFELAPTGEGFPGKPGSTTPTRPNGCRCSSFRAWKTSCLKTTSTSSTGSSAGFDRLPGRSRPARGSAPHKCRSHKISSPLAVANSYQ